ncbi:uncharacterized protein KY384_006807 [Bacidia gigantensis]|uniref:uncharacterized protein n=1 Tax=Bacidia gigantensis TaxID=2732470 RepID=UPI001D04DBF6|nr:uncharacterized protein KY384_006807 [Bacidia gigantensis]KAG8527891.1 hypothetical protein KY384_006807 [Bacidia gigantensis]
MWKSKRNVTISYKPLDPPSASNKDQIEDIVSYQTLSSDKEKTVLGIDTRGASTGEWDWRGKGWLKIASSHWEVLGYGDLEGGGQWAVTYFAKTLFTPAGIDVYSRSKEGVGEEILEGIKGALAKSEDSGVRDLAATLFEVTRN